MEKSGRSLGGCQLRFSRFITSLLLFSFLGQVGAVVPARKYSVEVEATLRESPPAIILTWPADTGATGYRVYRKSFEASSWTELGTLPGTATSYTDTNVEVGGRYEYMVRKSAVGDTPYTGYGFIFAGIRAPLIDQRGKVILLVESTYANDLAMELSRLEQDLVGDGWQVVRRSVSRNDSVPSVKAVIRSEYDRDPANVKALYLFGRIPVPYSGNIAPDGHENHRGAWPADVYYGDMDGSWTDSSVFNTNAERRINWNIPGDGKFDQSEIPSGMELQVGRVDLSGMTAFLNKTPSRNERDLLRQYLNKNNNFRQRRLNVLRRALVCDNFPDKGTDPVSGSAWRNFSAFFGPQNVVEVPKSNYLARVRIESYLWAYGNGGGSYYYSDGIANSDDFATDDIKVVFAMLMGSYFGDWDNESNFLRAALGSTSYVLASVYSGFPHSFYHHMALGEHIGHGIRLSQDNQGLYPVVNQGSRQVHLALMGDPTLRMHPVVPPSGLTRASGSETVTLNWNASTDISLQGYHVYRSISARGPFERLTPAPLSNRTFIDRPASGNHTYMVRAVKLEESASGTYFNASQGIFLTTTFSGSGTGSAPTDPSNLAANPVSSSQIRLSWMDTSANENGFYLERKTLSANFVPLASLPAGATAYDDNGLAPSTQYSYRIRAYNSFGESANSSEAMATTRPPTQTTNPPAFRIEVTGGGRVIPNLTPAQLIPGRTYTVTAIPNSGFLFDGWSGSVSSNAPRLRFVLSDGMELRANFITNPFIRLKGTYLGLIENDLPALSNSGLLTLTLTPSGTFSGRAQLGGRTVPVTGKFSNLGSFSNTFPRTVIGPLTVALQLPVNDDSDTATGTLAGTNFVSRLEAHRARFHSGTNLAPYRGSYTSLIVPLSAASSNAPSGYGFATTQVDASGKVRITGTLADGTPLSQSSTISKHGKWPLFTALYRNQGFMIGNLIFSNRVDSDFEGVVTWIKPPRPADKLYPAGFKLTLPMTGSFYVTPERSATVLNFSEGVVNLTSGNLAIPMEQTITLLPGGRVVPGSNNLHRLSLSIAPGTGLINGRFVHPENNRSTTMRGVIFKKQNLGAGFFPGLTEAGSLMITGE